MGTDPGVIGRYQLRRQLGRGAMGVVYEAHDPVLQRTVALKTILLGFAANEQERQAFEDRFMAEARAAARLSHPGILVVYDIGRDPSGVLYMALEYLKGRTLAELLAGGPLPWRQALRLTARAAEALAHAHEHGIIHRDVKPANLMLLESGDVKIMDFGVAKIRTEQLTTGGQILGSPSYMSPEQALGQPLDARSDLFSLGAVLYELLTGVKAFAGKAIHEILAQVAYQDPPPPRQTVAELPGDADYLVARALAKDPDDRYRTGQVLAEDAEDVAAGRSPRHRLGWTPPRPAQGTLTSKTGKPPQTGGRRALTDELAALAAQSSGAPTNATAPAAAPPAAVASAHPVPASPAPVPEPFDPSATGLAGKVGLALPQGKRVSLAILSGPRQGDVVALGKPQAIIGRAGAGAAADLELADPETSRVHAAVECFGARILVRDLGSRNGTFVDEQRVETRALEDRAEFRVGRTRIMLILTDCE